MSLICTGNVMLWREILMEKVASDGRDDDTNLPPRRLGYEEILFDFCRENCIPLPTNITFHTNRQLLVDL